MRAVVDGDWCRADVKTEELGLSYWCISRVKR